MGNGFLEDDTMKTLAGMTVLTALLIGGGMTSAQAGEAVDVWLQQAPQFLLAEGGSERLIRQQQHMEELASQRAYSDDGERFVQLIKEQPTAAGTAREQQDPWSETPKRGIQRDRELYGPH
jgi:hypothetical protein